MHQNVPDGGAQEHVAEKKRHIQGHIESVGSHLKKILLSSEVAAIQQN
jgi:hypothetical protein